jgi:hypothetical protein
MIAKVWTIYKLASNLGVIEARTKEEAIQIVSKETKRLADRQARQTCP